LKKLTSGLARPLIFLTLVVTLASNCVAGYIFTTVIAPGTPLGINNAGQIVGQAGNLGFLYNAGTLTTINPSIESGGQTLSSPSSANGINDAGEIVGLSGIGYNTWLDSGGNFSNVTQGQDPATYGKGSAVATGINNSGEIVGYYSTNQYLGFLDNSGVFTTISDPLADGETIANGINNSGQVVGWYLGIAGAKYGFVETAGIYTTISDPGAGVTVATGINDSGQIVGYYEGAHSIYYGFIYSNGAFTTISAGGENTFLTGINNSGQIVGYYDGIGITETGFVATPNASPEPSTLATAMAAILVVACRQLRKH